MNDKKVLIITYYWPPGGGSGVQRWLKFVKYLPQFGWSPVVVTPEVSGVVVRDESLTKDIPASVTIIRRPIWEPYELFQRISKLSGGQQVKPADFFSTGKTSLFKRISMWIRGNLFIPDPRVQWVRPTVRFLAKYVKENGIHTIVTTGPPHSMHLIGLGLKRRDSSLRWIADFRDPWTEWDILDTLPLTKRSRRKHQQLEREVITTADTVITIAPYHVARLEALSGRKVDLLTNGFDEEDFVGITRIRTVSFTISHIGVVDELRDPRPFMKALAELIHEMPELASAIEVKFIGNVNSAFQNDMKANAVVGGITSFIGQLPHDELLKQYGSTDLQLLILAHTAIAPGNLPGKFFEYLASGNPILALGPVDGDAAAILNKAHAGAIFERSDIAGIKQYVRERYQAWKTNTPWRVSDVRQFSRRGLTERLVNLLGDR